MTREDGFPARTVGNMEVAAANGTEDAPGAVAFA